MSNIQEDSEKMRLEMEKEGTRREAILAAFRPLLLGDYGEKEDILLAAKDRLRKHGIGASLLKDYDYPDVKLDPHVKFSVVAPQAPVIVLFDGKGDGTVCETGRIMQDKELRDKTILAYVGEEKKHHRPFKMRAWGATKDELIEDVVKKVRHLAEAAQFTTEKTIKPHSHESGSYKFHQGDNSSSGDGVIGE